MKVQRFLFCFTLLIGLCAFSAIAYVGHAYADTIYDETTNGDLSGDRNAPTTVNFNAGQNRLSATSVRGDLEYVHLVVPTGYQLEQTVVFSYTEGDPKSFIGIQRGSVFTLSNTITNPVLAQAGLLGYSHFGPGSNNVGKDILADMGAAAGSQGFTPSLPSGDYTIWLQQAGVTTTTYTLDFMVGPSVTKTIYAEEVDGDIPDNRQDPISRTLSVGGNLVSASSVRNDREYLRVNVPLGHQLDAILLSAYDSEDKKAFIGMQRGTSFTEPPQGTNPSKLLGYAHMGPTLGPIGADLLDNMAASDKLVPPAHGFTGALGSGDYSLWLQQTSLTTTTYTIDLIVSAVPTQVLYSEVISGDLANSGDTPTVLKASKGGNVISASSVRGDREYFAIEVPSGYQLEAIFLTSYNSTDQKAFLGVQRGFTFTEPFSGTNPANLLGYVHFGPGTEAVGNNILDNMGDSGSATPKAIGFSGALLSGTYVFWAQQAGTAATDYELNFVISEFPEAARLYLPTISSTK